MFIILAVVFGFAMIAILWLLFPLEDIKDFISTLKYMHKVKKEKKRMLKKGS